MNRKLNAIAGLYTPELKGIIEANRNCANGILEKTSYADEIAFEEFYIWWYHFIYARATDILAEKGEIIIPESGNFFFRCGN